MSDSDIVPSIPGNADLIVGDAAWKAKLKTDPAMTEEKWQKLATYFDVNSLSAVASSIICKAQDCPFYTSCFLRQEKIPLPVDNPCPIEETFKHRWAAELGATLGHTQDGYANIDLGMVVDLINTQLDIHRAQSELVDNPLMAERTIRGYDPQGNPIIDMKMNPTFFALKGARKLKQDILEALNATREARSKDNSRLSEDGAQMLTEFRKALEGGLSFGQVTREAEFVPPAIDPEELLDE